MSDDINLLPAPPDPFAVVATPDRPDPGDIIASAWGQWVQDRQQAAALQLLVGRSTIFTVPTD